MLLIAHPEPEPAETASVEEPESEPEPLEESPSENKPVGSTNKAIILLSLLGILLTLLLILVLIPSEEENVAVEPQPAPILQPLEEPVPETGLVLEEIVENAVAPEIKVEAINEPEPLPLPEIAMDEPETEKEKGGLFVPVEEPVIQKKRPVVEKDPTFVKEQLSTPITSVKFVETPIIEVVCTLSQITNIPITIDTDLFRLRGFSAEKSLSTELENVSAEELLKTVLNELDCDYVIENGQIFLTLKAREKNEYVEKRYEVGDLLKAQWSPQEITDVLTRLVSPKSWERASIRFDAEELIVSQTLLNHDEIDRLLEQLRILRDIPQKTPRIEGQLAPEVFGWDTVTEKISLNYLMPVPLTKCFTDLHRVKGIRVLINSMALDKEGERIENLQTGIILGEQSVDALLSEILGRVDLTYRIVDAKTIEATTMENALSSERMTLELHRLGESADGTPIEERVKSLKINLAPESWHTTINSGTLGLGDVYIDAISGCIIVRQGQPVQRMIRKFTREN